MSGNTTTYNYDADSNLKTQVYPNGTTATFTPDAADQTLAISDAKGTNQFLNLSYPRDGIGQVQSENTTGYGYDTINRVTAAGASAFTYDAGDNLTQLTTGATQKYDAANELLSVKANIGMVGTASGGDAGTTNSVTVNLPAGIQAGDQILVGTTESSAVTVTTPAGYNLTGSVTSGGAPADKTVLYNRTATGTETQVTLAYSAIATKSMVVAVYRGVDPVTRWRFSPSGSTTLGTTVAAPSVTTTAGYERLVLLEGAAGNATAANFTPPAGMSERVRKSTNAQTTIALTDQVLGVAGATGTRTATYALTANLTGLMVALKPAPPTTANITFAYDARGNRSGITPNGGATTTLAYDQANRLTGYGANATYAYNADGLRMSKTVPGVTEAFTYDVSQGLPLIIQDAATSYVTGLGGLPLEQISGSTVTYFHQDQLGSTRALTDSTGTVVGTAASGAYGEHATSTGITTPFQFAGQYKDAESGLVYLRARYYDPSTGQFISRDPLAAMTRQPYAYSGDNPLNATDPTGLFCLAFWDASQCDLTGAENAAAGIASNVGSHLWQATADTLNSFAVPFLLVEGDPVGDSAAVDQEAAMIGSAGTQTTSTTLLEEESGWHIDVENPAPGQRPGQIHCQDPNGNKYQYDFQSNSFRGAPGAVNKRLASDRGWQAAISKGRRYLGLEQ